MSPRAIRLTSGTEGGGARLVAPSSARMEGWLSIPRFDLSSAVGVRNHGSCTLGFHRGTGLRGSIVTLSGMEDPGHSDLGRDPIENQSIVSTARSAEVRSVSNALEPPIVPRTTCRDVLQYPADPVSTPRLSVRELVRGDGREWIPSVTRDPAGGSGPLLAAGSCTGLPSNQRSPRP